MQVHDVQQGTDEWFEARRGLITASDMHRLVTPTGKVRTGETPDAYAAELAAQRVAGFVELRSIGANGERGLRDELLARELYRERWADGLELREVGGCQIGPVWYSPDALVGECGLLEVKSRIPRLHLQTVAGGTVPAEHIVQCQVGLWVTRREWLDYVSYCGGMHAVVFRVYPDAEMHRAIAQAVDTCVEAIDRYVADYRAEVLLHRHHLTERIKEVEEMVL